MVSVPNAGRFLVQLLAYDVVATSPLVAVRVSVAGMVGIVPTATRKGRESVRKRREDRPRKGDGRKRMTHLCGPARMHPSAPAWRGEANMDPCVRDATRTPKVPVVNDPVDQYPVGDRI